MVQLLTFSERELATPKYTQLNQSHLLITISNPNTVLDFTPTYHCKQRLNIEFVDEENFTSDKICFDKDLATKILNFVNNYIEMVDTIIVESKAGVSRSVAVAAALSKIIDHKDDYIFSYAIPNMLVYLTLLDTYFSTPDFLTKWSKIGYLRGVAMKDLLDPAILRIAQCRSNKRGL